MWICCQGMGTEDYSLLYTNSLLYSTTCSMLHLFTLPIVFSHAFVHQVCNNLVLGISMAAVAEGLALGQALGLDPKLLSDVFNNSSARCWSSDTYNPCPVCVLVYSSGVVKMMTVFVVIILLLPLFIIRASCKMFHPLATTKTGLVPPSWSKTCN